MDFDGDENANEFRAKVRSFLQIHWENYPRGPNLRYPNPEAFRTSVGILKKSNWLAPHWPKQWGGAELPPVERYVLQEEMTAAGFPPNDAIAFDLAAPVIYTFGTAEQKARYLPKMLAGEEFWCQGFSEPDSGSDINSLRTSATRDGNHYIVEGRKIWTTNAHFAHMMFGLVKMKVGGKLQHGLTFILIDMHDPRVAVRGIPTIDGRSHINEVLLNEVRVPAANIVGEIGRGWTNARFLLANERVLVAQVPRTRQILTRIKRWAAQKQEGGQMLLSEPGFRQRLIQVEIDLFALEFAVLRVLYASGGEGIEGLPSVVKLRGADLRQRVSELAVEVLGERGLIFQNSDKLQHTHSVPADDELSQFRDFASSVAADYLFNLSASIAGGTSEIQRNLIAGLALEL